MSAINTALMNKIIADQKDKVFLDTTKQVEVANLTLGIFEQGVLRVVPSTYHQSIRDALKMAEHQAKSHVYQYNTSPAFTSSLPAPFSPAGQFAIEDIDEAPPPGKKQKKKTPIAERPAKYTAANHFVGSYMPVVMAFGVFNSAQAMTETQRLWGLTTAEMREVFLAESKGICAHHDAVKPEVIAAKPDASDAYIKDALKKRYKELTVEDKKSYYIKGNKIAESSEVNLASENLYADYTSLKNAIEAAAATAAATAAAAPAVC
jgi:hypothetical protein